MFKFVPKDGSQRALKEVVREHYHAPINKVRFQRPRPTHAAPGCVPVFNASGYDRQRGETIVLATTIRNETDELVFSDVQGSELLPNWGGNAGLITNNGIYQNGFGDIDAYTSYTPQTESYAWDATAELSNAHSYHAWGVCTEDIPAGASGCVGVHGVYQMRVRVMHPCHRYVEAAFSKPGLGTVAPHPYAQTTWYGSGEILRLDDDPIPGTRLDYTDAYGSTSHTVTTEERWALVRLAPMSTASMTAYTTQRIAALPIVTDPTSTTPNYGYVIPYRRGFLRDRPYVNGDRDLHTFSRNWLSDANVDARLNVYNMSNADIPGGRYIQIYYDPVSRMWVGVPPPKMRAALSATTVDGSNRLEWTFIENNAHFQDTSGVVIFPPEFIALDDDTAYRCHVSVAAGVTGTTDTTAVLTIYSVSSNGNRGFSQGAPLASVGSPQALTISGSYSATIANGGYFYATLTTTETLSSISAEMLIEEL